LQPPHPPGLASPLHLQVMADAASPELKASKTAKRNARKRKQGRVEKEKQRVDGALRLVGEWTYGAKDDRMPFWERSFSIVMVSDSAGSRVELSEPDGTRGVLTLANGWYSGDLYCESQENRSGSIRLQLHEDSDRIHFNVKEFPVPDISELDDFSDDDEDAEVELMLKAHEACNHDKHKSLQLYKDMKAKRKAEEKERKAKAREAEFARAPWQSTVISRRMPSVCHAQRSADAWSALVKRRASVIGTYAESQGTQNRARYLAVWPMALQFFGITERTRTMRVCSGFRVALLKSIDTLVSIELVNYMGGDPIFRSPEIFEAVVGGFVTSASVKVAKLNTGMVTDTVLKNIVTTCPQLEALDLRKACLSDSGSVALILKTCTTLRGLKLSFPYLSECPQSNTWHHAAIDALAASPGAHLIELAIEGFSAAIASRDPISSDNPESEELQLGAAALSRLLMCHGASLLSLSLASWPLSDELGLEIGKRCPNLQVLNISSPRKLGEDCSLSPAGLSWIADGCSHLKAVSLRKAEGAVSEDSLATLSRNCQDLVELDLSGCWDEWSSPMYTVTDAVLQAATSCGMTKLEVLDLYMTETSDLTLFALAATCPGLRRLDISTSASDVEGEGYLCPRDAEARTFTDEGLAALARGCHRLEWLNIHMCLRLTDKAIAALADHCRQLSYLDMSGANMDEGYQAFLVSKGAKPKPQMVGQYTDTSMLALKAACPALRRLNVASCPNICSSSLSDLQASRPGLEVQTTRIGRESCLELLLNG